MRPLRSQNCTCRSAGQAALFKAAFSQLTNQHPSPQFAVLRPPDVGPGDPRKRPRPDRAEVKLEAAGGEAGNNSAAVHDVYRERRKLRTKASPLHG